MTWLISACLAGQKCRYDGGSCLIEEIRRLAETGDAVTVCPEQLGGLSTPRCPSEIAGAEVITDQGENVTAAFVHGAEKALAIAMENGCTHAVLKEGSPSCGLHWVYDGTFSRVKTGRQGIFAEMLEKTGILCMNENEFLGEMGDKNI